MANSPPRSSALIWRSPNAPRSPRRGVFFWLARRQLTPPVATRRKHRGVGRKTTNRRAEKIASLELARQGRTRMRSARSAYYELAAIPKRGHDQFAQLVPQLFELPGSLSGCRPAAFSYSLASIQRRAETVIGRVSSSDSVAGGPGGGNCRFTAYFARGGVGGDGRFLASADRNFAAVPSSGNRNRISRTIVVTDFLEKRQHMFRTSRGPSSEKVMTFAIKWTTTVHSDKTTVPHVTSFRTRQCRVDSFSPGSQGS